jgi:hypothetical protein
MVDEMIVLRASGEVIVQVSGYTNSLDDVVKHAPGAREWC